MHHENDDFDETHELIIHTNHNIMNYSKRNIQSFIEMLNWWYWRFIKIARFSDTLVRSAPKPWHFRQLEQTFAIHDIWSWEFESSHRRFIDEQRQTTDINNRHTINDHYLQTISDIDTVTLIKHSPRFAILRHDFFLIFNIQSFFRDACLLECLTNARDECFDITSTRMGDGQHLHTNYTGRSRHTGRRKGKNWAECRDPSSIEGSTGDNGAWRETP